MTTGASETSAGVVLHQAQLTHTLAQILLHAIVTRGDRSAAWGAAQCLFPSPQAGWAVPMTAAPVTPVASSARPFWPGVAPAHSMPWHP